MLCAFFNSHGFPALFSSAFLLSFHLSQTRVPAGLSGFAASYFSPVKALVSPVPKIFKSMLSKKEEKKETPPAAFEQVTTPAVTLKHTSQNISRCRKA